MSVHVYMTHFSVVPCSAALTATVRQGGSKSLLIKRDEEIRSVKQAPSAGPPINDLPPKEKTTKASVPLFIPRSLCLKRRSLFK